MSHDPDDPIPVIAPAIPETDPPLFPDPPVAVQIPMQLVDIRDSPLVPDPHNARIHPQDNLDAIDWALDEVGGARSIVVDDDGVILAGNGTYRVAKKRGMKLLIIDRPSKDTLIAVRASGLSDREKRRLALWDNRASDLARWNRKVLKRMAEHPEQQLLDGLFDDQLLAELKGEVNETKAKYATQGQYQCPSCGHAWDGPKKPPRTKAPEESTAVQATDVIGDF